MNLSYILIIYIIGCLIEVKINNEWRKLMKINENESISEILDKILLLEGGNKKKKKITFLEGTLYFFGVASGLIIVAFLCLMIYKNNVSVDSLISLLLAFFSIFISILFYFKSTDTSNKFYDNSYNFMKDISVTLGKIEERFGEKLNNINDKISHDTEERSKQLKSVEDDMKTIKGLSEKAKLSPEEKDIISEKLQKKEYETEVLKQQIKQLKVERRNLGNRHVDNYEVSGYIQQYLMYKIKALSESEIINLSTGNFKEISESFFMKLRNDDVMDLNTEEAYKMIKTAALNILNGIK